MRPQRTQSRGRRPRVAAPPIATVAAARRRPGHRNHCPVEDLNFLSHNTQCFTRESPLLISYVFRSFVSVYNERTTPPSHDVRVCLSTISTLLSSLVVPSWQRFAMRNPTTTLMKVGEGVLYPTSSTLLPSSSQGACNQVSGCCLGSFYVCDL